MEEVTNINDIVKNPGEFKIHSDVKNLELYSDDYPFKLSLRIRNFTDESSYLKFVRNCEKLFRGSLEYKLWKDYILDVLQYNTCMITDEKMSEVSIEVHHHIPSLFILIKTIINEYIENNKEFSTFDICIKTIEVHFSNLIGYVCLVGSMHEKFTNGYLDIPVEVVKGNYREFLNQYSKYINEEDFDEINKRLASNLENCKHTIWKKDEYPVLEKLTGGSSL